MLRLLLLFCFTTLLAPVLKAEKLTDTIARNSLLYNGTEYTKTGNFFNEHAFFQEDQFYPGTIYYTGNQYDNVELQYDCMDELVLVKDPFRARRIVLVTEKIKAFTLGGHHFIQPDGLKGKPTFYEILYQGKRSVLLQWKKVITRDQSLQERYLLQKTLYLLDGTSLTKISKAADLTRLMGNKKKKLQQFYREKNLSFRTDPYNAAIQLVQKGEGEGW
jgi:hypothetical protein